MSRTDAAIEDVVSVEDASDTIDVVPSVETAVQDTLVSETSDASETATDASAEAAPTNNCPRGWVPGTRGGCGPAVFLCAFDGGAAAGACTGIDITQRTTVMEPDGGVGTNFYRSADGGLSGGWKEPGSADGPPAVSWEPTVAPTDCPTGWTRGPRRSCLPQFREDCPLGTLPLPNNTCSPTAESDCPTSEFPPDPGAEAAGARVVYARAIEVIPGIVVGSGTRTDPFLGPDISTATRAAGTNGWVLLAPGRYNTGNSIIVEPVHIVGGCPNRVEFQLRGILAPTLDLRSMRIRGGISVRGAGELRFSRVRVFDGPITVSGEGRTLIASDFFLSAAPLNVLTLASVTVTRGVLDGLLVDGPRAQLTLVDSTIQNAEATVRSGGTLTLQNSALRGVRLNIETRIESGGSSMGGTVTATRSAVVNAPHQAVQVTGSQSSLSMTDSLIYRTRQQVSEVAEGQGLSVTAGGRAMITRTVISQGQGYGVFAAGMGSELTMTDSVIEQTAPLQITAPGSGADAGTDASAANRFSGITAAGIRAESQARVTGTGVLVTDNSVLGVQVVHPGTLVTLQQSSVRRTQWRNVDLLGGSGIEIAAGGRLVGNRLLVAENNGSGVLVTSALGNLSLSDSAIVSTRPRRSDGSLGVGLVANFGAQATIERSILSDNLMAGAYLTEPDTRLVITDSTIRRTQMRMDGTFGSGIELARGAKLTARRLLLEQNTEFGISVFQQRTSSTLEDTIIAGVTPSRAGFGLGLAVYGGAEVDATRLTIVDVRGAGIASVPYDSPISGRQEFSFVRSTGTFIRNVSAGTVRFASTTSDASSERLVSYGLHVGTNCFLVVDSFLIEGGEYGFFHSGGTLELRRGTIAAQRFIGAVNGEDPMRPLLLQGTSFRDNESSELLRNVDIPAAQIDRPATPNLVLPSE